MPVEFPCAKCGKALRVPDGMAGKAVRCPSCQAVVTAGAAPPPPAPAAAVPSAPVPAGLPETMLANRTIAGKICPSCSRAVGLGVPVHNCPACGATHHDPCWAGGGGCAAAGCPSREEAAAPAEASSPCPHCSEPLPKDTLICPHCGEGLRQFPVTFDRGRDRVWGAQVADIRHRDGVIRLTGNGLEIQGQACLPSAAQTGIAVVAFLICGFGVIIPFVLMEYVILTKKTFTYALDEIVRVVFERDKRHLLLGVRPSGKKAVTWYRCRSPQMDALWQALGVALGAERVEERNSWENIPLAKDLALNWSIAAVLLPIPFLGFVFSIAAVWHVVKAWRLTRGWSVWAVGLAVLSLFENGLIAWLIVSK